MGSELHQKALNTGSSNLFRFGFEKMALCFKGRGEWEWILGDQHRKWYNLGERKGQD